MGEALITRRGGSVKRGSITTPLASAHTKAITDPALVNMKNGVLFLSGEGRLSVTGGYTQYPLVSVVIEDGQVARATQISEGALVVSPAPGTTFDPSTGTIAGYEVIVNSSDIPMYEYIIFD